MTRDELEKVKVGDIVQHAGTLDYYKVVETYEGYKILQPVLSADDADLYTVVYEAKEAPSGQEDKLQEGHDRPRRPR